LGLGAQFAPTYDGAQRYRVEPGPSIDVRYRDLWFASTGEGVGVNVVGSEHVRAGVAISYDLGREVNEDSSRLHGLGSIAPAPEAKLFAEYSVARSLPLVVRVDVRRAVGGANGVICDLGAYLPMPGSGQHFFWLAGPSMSFADATYMNRYFGIGAAQALRSGDARYKADAGLKSAGFGVSATWFVSRHWLVNSTAAFTQLLGSAARSPITEAASEGVLTLAVTYRF
jgi:outer membrane scaffolding protein for murein synthesis (MipA/OmpV family)